MSIYNRPLVIESDLKTVFSSTWSIIRSHIAVMSLIWSVFYIPTNIFILLRSGEMMRNLSRGSSGVFLLMIILNLLGSIPNIAMVLLVRNRECDDYNTLVVSSFKSLPAYITTTLTMLLSMLPLMFFGILSSTLILSVLDKTGVSQIIQIAVALPIIIACCVISLLRYFSSVNFYLMNGVRNFRAARLSRVLYKYNRKKILAVFGVCSFLPMFLNFITLYLVDSEAVNILTGFLLGYYMFLSSGFFAGVFLHIREEDSEESSIQN